MNIRPMLPADIPDCACWVAETPLWQRYGITEQSFSDRLRAGLANGATVYVAADEEQVLGFLWLVERGAFDRSGYVELIGVRPTSRSRGVGRALMEFAEAQVFAQGRDLFLLVSDFNHDAQRFYRGMGYRQAGVLEDYVIQGVAELIFWKTRHGVNNADRGVDIRDVSGRD